MTSRQTALLDYRQDLAAFGTNAKAPVFVILDLDDSVGFEIASHYQPNCTEKRDAIKDTGAYPFAVVACAGTAGLMFAVERWLFPENRKAKIKAPDRRNRISRPAGF